MKKLLILSVCALAAVSANAQFKFTSLDNNDGKTTIVIVDDNFKSGTDICCAKFNNDGKTYDAKSMVTTQEDGKMSITMTFKKLTVFRNSSVTLTVNGQHTNVSLPLPDIANQLSDYSVVTE